MKVFKMPDRQPEDGQVSIRRLLDGRLALSVTTNGAEQFTILSEFNAWRIFGMLSLFLELPLLKHVSKAIKLGESVEMFATPGGK